MHILKLHPVSESVVEFCSIVISSVSLGPAQFRKPHQSRFPRLKSSLYHPWLEDSAPNVSLAKFAAFSLGFSAACRSFR